MGSRSYSTTTAIDNRQAVTDQAIGLSNYGSNNNATAYGNIFNLSAGGVVGGGAGRTGGGSGSGTGGSVNLNILDGGVIDRAFDFASLSLSEMLGSVIDGQKQQIEAANYQSDTIGQALQQSAQVQAQQQEKTLAWMSSNGKILAGGTVALLVGWWIWKGRKK